MRPLRWPTPGLLALAVGLGGCAHTPDADLFRLGDVDRGPELLGCSQYSPPQSGARMYVRVQVDFDVSETGAVMNPQARPSAGARKAGLVTTALVAARSCRYRPAVKDGRPVAVQGLSRRFVFALSREPDRASPVQ